MNLSQIIVRLPRPVRAWLRRRLRRAPYFYVLPSGVRIEVGERSEWGIYNDLFVTGEYDPGIHLALQSAGSGARLRVVDLGANVGLFMLRFLDLARRGGWKGKVEGFAVEGVPETYSKLRHKLAGYPELEGFECIQGLVGRRSGGAHIGVGEDPVAASAGEKLPGTEYVPYVDVEQRFERLGEIDLLKCDIEGSEGDLLDGYPDLLARTRVLVIEFHPSLCDPARLRGLIAAAGLELIVERAGVGESSTCVYGRRGNPGPTA